MVKERNMQTLIKITEQPESEHDVLFNSYGEEQKMFININQIKQDLDIIRSTVLETNKGNFLIKEIQQDAVSNQIYHISAIRIVENRKYTAKVMLNVINWGIQHKKLNKTAIRNYLDITVDNYKNLISKIDIDLSKYTSPAKIYASEIISKYPGIKFHIDPSNCILKIEELKVKIKK